MAGLYQTERRNVENLPADHREEGAADEFGLAVRPDRQALHVRFAGGFCSGGAVQYRHERRTEKASRTDRMAGQRMATRSARSALFFAYPYCVRRMGRIADLTLTYANCPKTQSAGKMYHYPSNIAVDARNGGGIIHC